MLKVNKRLRRTKQNHITTTLITAKRRNNGGAKRSIAKLGVLNNPPNNNPPIVSIPDSNLTDSLHHDVLIQLASSAWQPLWHDQFSA